MRIRVLGCSGGIGAGSRTSALLIDDDVLIDAGTGIGDLALEDIDSIRHVFLTHAHLDHIAGLPMLVDRLFLNIWRLAAMTANVSRRIWASIVVEPARNGRTRARQTTDIQSTG